MMAHPTRRTVLYCTLHRSGKWWWEPQCIIVLKRIAEACIQHAVVIIIQTRIPTATTVIHILEFVSAIDVSCFRDGLRTPRDLSFLPCLSFLSGHTSFHSYVVLRLPVISAKCLLWANIFLGYWLGALFVSHIAIRGQFFLNPRDNDSFLAAQ